MKLDRTKNTLRNSAVEYLSKLILLLFPFITRSVFTALLGAEYLGLNGLFSSILTVLNMTELGFSSAIVVHMYRAIASEDTALINALLNYYKRIYRIVGLIILSAGCAVIPFLPRLIKGGYPADINLTVVYLVYLFDTTISYFLFAYYSSLISAFQRADLLTGVNVAVKLIMYALQMGVLLLVRNYYVYLTIMPICTVLNNTGSYYMAKRFFPQYSPQGGICAQTKADIGQKVKGAVIGKVAAVFRNTFDSIFISAFLGLTATAIYGNYYYILNTISSFLSVIPGATLGGVGNSVALDTQEKNYRDMNRMNFLYLWLSGWCMTCMLCLYQPFMKLWMGETMLLPVSTMVLFCVYLYIMKIGEVLSIYTAAKGLYWEERFVASAEAVANIALNYILGKYFGISGIMWATIISMIAINFLWGCRIVFKYYFTDFAVTGYILQQFGYAAASAMVAAITYWVCSFVKIQGFIGLIAIGCICVVVPNVLYVVVYRKTKMYKDAVPWIMEKLGTTVIAKKWKK